MSKTVATPSMGTGCRDSTHFLKAYFESKKHIVVQRNISFSKKQPVLDLVALSYSQLPCKYKTVFPETIKNKRPSQRMFSGLSIILM